MKYEIKVTENAVGYKGDTILVADTVVVEEEDKEELEQYGEVVREIEELEEKNVSELRNIAQGYEISGYSSMKKKELIKEIKKARGEES